MKFAKYFFASFLLLAIASAFVLPKHHAKKATAKHNAKRTSYTKYFQYSEVDVLNNPVPFIITDGTDARLQTTGNWSQPGSAPSCSGTTKICFFTITYTCTDGFNCPTDADLLNALATRFTESLPHSGAFVFDTAPPANTITITGVGPNGGVTVTYVLTEKS